MAARDFMLERTNARKDSNISAIDLGSVKTSVPVVSAETSDESLSPADVVDDVPAGDGLPPPIVTPLDGPNQSADIAISDESAEVSLSTRDPSSVSAQALPPGKKQMVLYRPVVNNDDKTAGGTTLIRYSHSINVKITLPYDMRKVVHWPVVIDNVNTTGEATSRHAPSAITAEAPVRVIDNVKTTGESISRHASPATTAEAPVRDDTRMVVYQPLDETLWKPINEPQPTHGSAFTPDEHQELPRAIFLLPGGSIVQQRKLWRQPCCFSAGRSSSGRDDGWNLSAPAARGENARLS